MGWLSWCLSAVHETSYGEDLTGGLANVVLRMRRSHGQGCKGLRQPTNNAKEFVVGVTNITKRCRRPERVEVLEGATDGHKPISP